MPWTPAEASNYKKGLSARQRRQWAAVANSVLRRCLAEGRSQSTCEASAIRQANGAVGRPELSTEQRRLTINTALTVQPQRLTLNNREYLTAPAVLIVEGVLNGGLIPADALVPEDWNGAPIVLEHPTNDQGIPVSARTPDVLSTYGLGHVYRARLGQGQRQGQAVSTLQAELWLDIAQVTTLGGTALQAMQMLEAQRPLEISTGFYAESAPMRGTFYGMPYQEIHHVLRPDHLALLPNGVGACSWDQGCGAPRLHEQQCACPDPTTCTCHAEEMIPMEEIVHPPWWRRFFAMLRLTPQASGGEVLTIEQTDMDVREALYGALAREMGDNVNMTPYFIQDLDVAESSFTYREGERLKRRRWRMEEGLLVLEPDVEDVQRTTTYTPVPVTEEQQPAQEEPAMAGAPSPHIKRRVDALITHERTQWTEDDRHFLEAQEEAFLIRLEQQPLAPPAKGPRTFEEMLAEADPSIRESHAEALENIAERKQAAIALLIANKTCPFSEDELHAMTAKRLEQLVTMSGAVLPNANADYRGKGMAAPLRQVDPETLPPEPPNVSERVLARQKELGMGAYFR